MKTSTIDEVLGVLVALNYWCCMRGVALVVHAAKDRQIRSIDHLRCHDMNPTDSELLERFAEWSAAELLTLAVPDAEVVRQKGSAPADTLPFVILGVEELAGLLEATHLFAVSPSDHPCRGMLAERLKGLGPLGGTVAYRLAMRLKSSATTPRDENTGHGPTGPCPGQTNGSNKSGEIK